MIARELAAGVLTVAGLGFFGAAPLLYEGHARSVEAASVRTIVLTGVHASGVWTDAAVDGLNYWRRDFPKARPVLRVGEAVIFRLTSSDVIHAFYVPELGIGPVEVYPGNIVEVRCTPRVPGVYGYYCTAMCGDCHFHMQGEIVVAVDPSTAPPEGKDGAGQSCETIGPRPSMASAVARGGWLFGHMGCTQCHGKEGRGGVVNPNYAKRTVPTLRTLAERMFIESRESAACVIAAIEQGETLADVAPPPYPRFRATVAQYDSVRGVIAGGSRAAKADPNGPEPPLQMPSWRARLNSQDIDAIIAYLISIYPWEEMEGDDPK